MLLKIDPSTPKGQAQLEAIGWAQDQINEILKLYFSGKYKVQRGLRVEFRLGLDLQMNEKVKVDVMSLDPKTDAEWQQAVSEAKETYDLIAQNNLQPSAAKEEKKDGNV